MKRLIVIAALLLLVCSACATTPHCADVAFNAGVELGVDKANEVRKTGKCKHVNGEVYTYDLTWKWVGDDVKAVGYMNGQWSDNW